MPNVKTSTSRKSFSLKAIAQHIMANITSRISAYLARRPHRSFRRSRVRDYRRSLQLPGYLAFTAHVIRTIRQNSRLFTSLVIIYTLLGAIFVGLSSQESYSQLSQLLDETGGDIFTQGWGSIGQAGLLLFAGLSGGLSLELTDVQQVYSVLILLLTWLTAVWLLRGIVAGKRPKLRDGIYNAGSPIVATGVVLLVLVIQLLPATIAILLASTAASTGLYENGFMAMIITITAILFVVLSAYWSVATFFAMIIVTLPGMYPWQALRTAGDMVIGRRVRLLLRLLWMVLLGVCAWVVIVLLLIVFTRLLSIPFSWLNAMPLVPIGMSVMSAAVVVWSSAYVYLLYRKVVEDDAKPA